jgi:hypothetical protein
MRRAFVGFPTFASETVYCGAKWFVLAGFGVGPAAPVSCFRHGKGDDPIAPSLIRVPVFVRDRILIWRDRRELWRLVRRPVQPLTKPYSVP